MKDSNKVQRQFEGILDRYFQEVLADHPVMANQLGLRSGEGKLGNLGLAFERRQEKRRCRILGELDQLAVNELSGEQHLDRLALRAQLLAECEDFARGKHNLEPDGVDVVFGILLHELQRGEDKPSRARRNIRGILKETPRYLSRAARMIRWPERVWRRIMQQTVSGAEPMYVALSDFLGKGDLKAIAAMRRAVENAYHLLKL